MGLFFGHFLRFRSGLSTWGEDDAQQAQTGNQVQAKEGIVTKNRKDSLKML